MKTIQKLLQGLDPPTQNTDSIWPGARNPWDAPLLHFVVPFSTLDRWATLSRYHVVSAADLFIFETVRNFYLRRRKAGAYLIVDLRLSQGGNAEDLLGLAQQVQAHEVIVPDFYDADAGDWVRDTLPLVHAAQARDLRVMIPVAGAQGEETADWLARYRTVFQHYPNSIGIPAWIDPNEIAEEVTDGVPHHLFGVDNPRQLAEWGWYSSWLRGVTTDHAAKAAFEGIAFDPIAGWLQPDPDPLDSALIGDARTILLGDYNHLCVLRWSQGFEEGGI